MTTRCLTPETIDDINNLTNLVHQRNELEARMDELKWRILDTNQAGVQTIVAKIYGVRRQAVGQWVKDRRNKPQETA